MQPKLSIIVPVFNVEKYLDACLNSILAQDYPNFELILINDGSTDRSGEIADGFARGDSRLTVLHQENRGNGQARNLGVQQSTGDFITFVDADDLVVRDGFGSMMSQLRASGSEFCAGGVMRIDERGNRSPSNLHRGLFDADIVATNVRHMPGLFRDTTLWNKVYVRNFVLSTILPIPEGTFYEDLHALTRAYINAQSVDLLAKTVYLWRKRGDQTSITQSMAEMRTLKDRLSILAASKRLVIEEAPDLLPALIAKYFAVDFPIMMRSMKSGETGYRSVAGPGMTGLVRDLPVKGTDFDVQVVEVVRLLENQEYAALNSYLGKLDNQMSKRRDFRTRFKRWYEAVGRRMRFQGGE